MSDQTNMAITIKELRQQVDDLYTAYQSGDAKAAERIRKKIARFSDATESEIISSFISYTEISHVIAREHGFEYWHQLLNVRDRPEDAQFEAAVDAVISGEVETLKSLLKENTALVHARSSCRHRATLVHYVSANGVEDERQKAPPNGVEIARVLLEAGAEVDAVSESYDGGSNQTPLCLLVTDSHTAEAGTQTGLVEILCKHGAQVNGLENDGAPLVLALAFRNVPSAETLFKYGARTDNLISAAALGKLESVKIYFDENRRLKAEAGIYAKVCGTPENSAAAIEQAFVFACMAGRRQVVEYLLQKGVDVNAKTRMNITGLHEAALGGIWKCKWLIENGADPNIKDHQFDSTPIGWANEGGHHKIAELLRKHLSK